MAKIQYASVLLLLLDAIAGQSIATAPHCSLKGCFSSVFTSQSSIASSDCQSYFRVTKSPCPASGTTTITGPPSTVTVTARSTSYTKTVYDISTVVQTSLTTLTTRVSTLSSTELDTAYIYNTETTTALDTAAATISTTSTLLTDFVQPAAPTGGPVKRNIIERAGCTPITYAPTAIPIYASACGAKPGNLQYYAACSCFGATPTTTTLPQSTIVVRTVTVTPKVTVTTTIPVTGGRRVLTLNTTLSYQTSVTSTTSETLTSATTITVATITSASQTITISSTSTSATTQLVVETGCPLVALNSVVQGQHLALSTGPFGFTSDPTKASLFYVEGGQLYVSPDSTFRGQSSGPVTPGVGLQILFHTYAGQYVIFDSSVYQTSYYYPASCQLNSDNTVSCVGSGPASGQNAFCTYNFPGDSEYFLTACPSGSSDSVTLAFNCNA